MSSLKNKVNTLLLIAMILQCIFKFTLYEIFRDCAFKKMLRMQCVPALIHGKFSILLVIPV